MTMQFNRNWMRLDNLAWVLSLIIFIVSQSQSILVIAVPVCPIELHTFKNSDCNSNSSNNSNDDHETSAPDLVPVNDNCHFVLDGLYRVSCENDALSLQPCFESMLVKPKSYALNACFANPNPHDNSKGSYSMFQGSCDDFTTCLATNNPAASSSPTTAPAPTRTRTSNDNLEIAAMVDLPSPPLPPNKFADEPLDVILAHEIVYLAGRLVYQMLNEDMARSLLPEGYQFHFWADTGSTEVLIISTEHGDIAGSASGGANKGKILVLFRGTDDTPDGDWLRNINLPKCAFGPDNSILDGRVEAQDIFGLNKTYEIRVHRGFNKVFNDNLYEKVMAVIQPLLDKPSAVFENELYYENTIYFGGHSLGGADSQLFGTYFAHFHPEVKTYITTLGSPRQGNYAYKILVESMPNLSVWRMVNCRDVVPRLPNFNYYHAGNLMWKKCLGPKEDPIPNDVVEAYYRQSGDLEQDYASTPRSFVVNSFESTMIADHFGYAYLEWLEYARHSFPNYGKNWTSTFEPMLVG